MECGRHWKGIINIQTKSIFLFDSIGFPGLKTLVIQNDKNIVQKNLYDINKILKKGLVITLISLKFSVHTCQNLKLSIKITFSSF